MKNFVFASALTIASTFWGLNLATAEIYSIPGSRSGEVSGASLLQLNQIANQIAVFEVDELRGSELEVAQLIRARTESALRTDSGRSSMRQLMQETKNFLSTGGITFFQSSQTAESESGQAQSLGMINPLIEVAARSVALSSLESTLNKNFRDNRTSKWKWVGTVALWAFPPAGMAATVYSAREHGQASSSMKSCGHCNPDILDRSYRCAAEMYKDTYNPQPTCFGANETPAIVEGLKPIYGTKLLVDVLRHINQGLSLQSADFQVSENGRDILTASKARKALEGLTKGYGHSEAAREVQKLIPNPVLSEDAFHRSSHDQEIRD